MVITVRQYVLNIVQQTFANPFLVECPHCIRCKGCQKWHLKTVCIKKFPKGASGPKCKTFKTSHSCTILPINPCTYEISHMYTVNISCVEWQLTKI